MNRWGNHKPTRVELEASFSSWLYGAMGEKVLATTVEQACNMHRGVDRRVVECKLIARQDVLRRQQASAA